MKTNPLQEALKPYYRKAGNKLLFRNGMSLSQLGWRMGNLLYERYELQSFGPPALWRVIHGKRLFTPPQLEIFCQLVGATPDEWWTLEAALVRARNLRRYNFDPDLSISPRDVDYANRTLERIRAIRVSGEADQMIEWATEETRRLRHFPMTSSRLWRPLQRVQGMLLFELATAYAETAPPGTIEAFSTPVLNEMREIAHATEDAELLGLADHRQGEVYYVTKDYPRSIQYMLKAADSLKNPDDRLLLWRTLGLDYAYLGEQEGQPGKYESNVRSLLSETKHLIAETDGASLAEIARSYEGFGRAFALSGLSEGPDILEQGWEYSSQMEKENRSVILRQVQLARSSLEVAQRLGIRRSRLLETRAKQGLENAQLHGYRRHQEFIERALKRNS